MAKRLCTKKQTTKKAAPLPLVAEQWATVNLAALAKGEYGVCIWGTKADAEEGCDFDERVARVRIEVLEIR